MRKEGPSPSRMFVQNRGSLELPPTRAEELVAQGMGYKRFRKKIKRELQPPPSEVVIASMYQDAKNGGHEATRSFLQHLKDARTVKHVTFQEEEVSAKKPVERDCRFEVTLQNGVVGTIYDSALDLEFSRLPLREQQELLESRMPQMISERLQNGELHPAATVAGIIFERR